MNICVTALNVVWRRPPLCMKGKGLMKYKYQIISSAKILC